MGTKDVGRRVRGVCRRGRSSISERRGGAAILVLQFTLLFGGHWIRELDFFRSPDGKPLLDDSTFACLPAVFLFVIPSVIRPGQSLLTWPVVHERFDFGLLLLIGGGFAIAKGFAESGLNAALGDWLATVVDSESDVVLTFLLILVCTLSTQVFSALGTATTVLPVLKAVAARSVHNPLALVLPATIACSFAFMLPTAAPCNIVVLAKSRDLAACHHRLLLCVHVADRRPVQHRGARQVSRPCRLPPSLAPLRSCCRPPPRATSWCSPSLATLPCRFACETSSSRVCQSPASCWCLALACFMCSDRWSLMSTPPSQSWPVTR